MDERRIACDRCGAEVGAEERHAEIEYVYGDGGGSMTLCRDCFKLVMDTVHGQEAKRQGDAEPPTMDERRAVARRMREYKCPVLPSHQTTREAVDAAVECMGLGDGEEICTVRQFLDRLAELIDPGEDVSMSAYDLLPEEDRESLRWVNEHGGLENVSDAWDETVNLCATIGCEPNDESEMLQALGDCTDIVIKRLMPEGTEWPRDAKGVPIVRGETVFANGGDKGDGRAWHVRRVCPGSAYPVDAEDGKGERRDLKPEWLTHKRPAPKVLDADGVEIRVGDVLYRKSDGHMVKVAEVYEKTFTDADGYVRPGDGFTHRAPVLAADGRPLREGETVYKLDDDRPYTLKRFDGDHVYINAGGSSFDIWTFPGKLTHERPETRQSIVDEIGEEIAARIDKIVSAGRWN